MPEREWSRPTAPTSQFPSFDQLDANRDGVITREEWSAGFGKAPPVDEQERLERNLAALAATVTAPATRRSPDYTSATFETFERGAFSDTFERGTVALPPSGAAATAEMGAARRGTNDRSAVWSCHETSTASRPPESR